MPLAHTPEPTYALTSVFYSKSAMAPYGNEELDRLILQAGGLLDPQARADAIRRAYRLLHEDVGVVPIWSAITTLGMRNDVNYVPASSETVRLTNVSWSTP
jgi:ABC-type transport system substrate-binding protein